MKKHFCYNNTTKKAKAIMIQGTTSNAGKSLLVTALCRIFKQDGYKVAPFKAQNMALNSYITKEGLEMGRAQVVQAEAAGIDPSVIMNPVLLKPTNDTKSQVIVNGEVWNDMDAKEYYRNKRVLVPKIREAYEKLADENDIIVIEGAGSPAEINLKENDIVNMFMAKLAKAPVLLVGDIDRGGVFAALVGTMVLFEEEEREIIKGLVINKFRGDVTILSPGLKLLEEKAGKPVLGVVPYMDVDIEDEDSLSSRLMKRGGVAPLDLAVVRFPRISNFTDFQVFEAAGCADVRYVTQPDELGNPDMIFLPGTKNTMEDLLWLRGNGLEAAIKKFAAADKPVFGVCGGYQMLGEVLEDPFGVEHGGTMAGIGLLPGKTVFAKEKVRTRVTGTFGKVDGIFSDLRGKTLSGYEIHMGNTCVIEGNKREGHGLACLTKEEGTHMSKAGKVSEGLIRDKKAERPDGMNSGNVYGSYVHGIFDEEGVVKTILKALLKAKGMDAENLETLDIKSYKDSQYDKLAAGVRSSMDIDKIYEILDKGLKR